MKIKKIMLAGLMVIAMNLSLIACGKEERESSQGSPEQKTENTKPTEESRSSEGESESEETKSEEETKPEEETSSAEESTQEESSGGETEFVIPVQEDFVPVEGLSDKYVDFENRSFAYNGQVFKLGESTLKDLIDGGVPFDEGDLNNRGNNVNKNYETGRYDVDLNDYVFLQLKFVNVTDGNLTEEECLLSYVRYCSIYVPQPDYEAERNATITEKIFDAANSVCFSFPLTLTKEQLLENSGEGAEQDDYNNVNYHIASEIYLGGSGYKFQFDKNTNQMKEMTMDWIP